MAMSHLDAVKDAFDGNTDENPFQSLFSSQFGLEPNESVEATQPTTPPPVQQQGEWGTGTSSKSNSPNRRAGYARGTAAELRARKLHDLKTQQALRTAQAQSPLQEPSVADSDFTTAP